MRFDVLIRNGQLIDGTGSDSRQADLGILDGKVAAIDNLPFAEAEEDIDATGNVLTPGFVDIHSHGDLILAWPSDKRFELLKGRIAQGITTEVIGNCGLGATPLFGKATELLPAINGWMSPEKYKWDWSDCASYCEYLKKRGLPMNVALLVGHGPLRLGAMGLAFGEPDLRARTSMAAALEEALDQGVLGLSAGLIYPPGMYASTDELIHLAGIVRRYDGVFTCHVRGSSETLLPAVEELIHIGQETDVRVHHSHAEAVGRTHWSKLSTFLEKEATARRQGVSLSADMFPYPVAATMMLAIYPPWSLEGGLSKLIERLRVNEIRTKIRRDIETVVPEWPPWQQGGWPHNLVKAVGWDRILVSTVASEQGKKYEGLSLHELGEALGVHPFEAISDLMIEEDGNIGQFVLDISGEEGLRLLARDTEIAFITDANDYGKGEPHPAAYGSFPKILGQFVREEGVLMLPEAVRRMTSLPADIIGLKDRGRIYQGSPADIVVFDPKSIRDRTSLAAGRVRPAGVNAVVVNGTTVFRSGVFTGKLPGTVLRR